MPITPGELAQIVTAVEESPWAAELRSMLPRLSAVVSGSPSGPSGFSLPGGDPPSGSLPIKSKFRRQKMCGKAKNGRRRHERRQSADGTTIVSPERFAKMVNHRVKKMVDRNVRDGVHIPYGRLKEIATHEINSGIPVRYSYADALPPATPAGSSAGRFGQQGREPANRGSVGSGYLNQNRGTDGKPPAPIDTTPPAVEVRQRLDALRERIDEEQRELTAEARALRCGFPTPEQIAAHKAKQARLDDLYRQVFGIGLDFLNTSL
jgi:hypothetical protein